ncbi:MAG: integrase arm-type DNA-binding domain-containing protein [Pseudomonadota bacterium]
MPLSDVGVRSLKPAERPRKVFDGGGLYLLVTPKGARLWRMKYRVGGREKTLAIGKYPAVGLKEARKARDEARELIGTGIDPMVERKRAKALATHAASNTFRAIAAEHLGVIRTEGRAPATINKLEWLVGIANADFGDRPITEISARDILSTLKRLEAKGNFETAKRLRSSVSRVFRYAVATDRAETDPTFALRGAIASPPAKPMAALTDWDGIRLLMRTIDTYQGQFATKVALRLSALLVPRPGELRKAEWSEFDLASAVWVVPAERMKMRRPHRVPLPSQAIGVLHELRRVTGDGLLVFPSVRSPRRPMSENTVTAALRSLGYLGDEMTAHGFRATFSTLANEAGLWSADAIERALAHVDANKVRRVYARGEHWEERVKLMQWWADEIYRSPKP